MPINKREVLSVVTQLTEDKHVRVTIHESLKGGCIAAATTVVGGICLGPVGLAIGGIVGGCTAAVLSKNQFKPLSQVIINDMTDAQRERLATSVSAIIADLCVEDVAVLLQLLLNSPGTKEAVVSTNIQVLKEHAVECIQHQYGGRVEVAESILRIGPADMLA